MCSEGHVDSLVVDALTVFEGDQEEFRHGGAEILYEGRETGTYYGTLEDSSRRTVRGDQG